ncbi:hypothetical protein [Maribellus luteus]|nr:hypothetical protein [Maribellus luteus]
MYTSSIIWMLTWPLLIVVSYQLVKLVVRKYDRKLESKKNETE